MKCELYHDNFQNFKRYNVPKAQLVIADIPYNIGADAYASNPMWYKDGDNKNGESKLAKQSFFHTDGNFRIAEYMHFCNRMLRKEPKEKGQAPAMIVFCAFEQMQTVIEYGKQYGFMKSYPLFFVKNYSAQVLKANMKIVGATEFAVVLYRDKLPKFRNVGADGERHMVFDWISWERDKRSEYPKGSTIYHKTEYRDRRDHFAFYTVNDEIDGYDTDRDSFIGLYNGFHNPQAVEAGKANNSFADGWSPIASHYKKITLAPGESKTLVFILGYVEMPVDKKFEADGVTINKEKALAMIEQYNTPEKVAAGLEELKATWDRLLSVINVDTPDDKVNRMVNIWNQYQCMVTFNLSRSASYFESGIGRGMGFRDSNQDILGFVHQIPDRARQRIIDIASTQLPDGGCYHQYQPLTKKGNSDIGGDFSDDPLWMILSVSAYIKETGDWSILDEMVPYDNDESKAKPMLDHLKVSFYHIVNNLGPHGLPLAMRADWNDCINLSCYSDTPGESFQTYTNPKFAAEGGYSKIAESVMVATLFTYTGPNYVSILKHLGKDDEAAAAQAEIDKMKKNVMESAFDGDWFLRAYDSTGAKMGSKECEEGKIFIEPQGFAVMSEIGKDEGADIKTLDSIDKYLNTKYGLVLNNPAYSKYYIQYGEISTYPGGYKENAGIFTHNNAWIICAEAYAGRGDKAFEYYSKIAPAFNEEISDLHKTEPYVYGQMIAGKDASRFGEGKNSWLTGTAAWNMVAISQYILGVQADFDGLKIDPSIPHEWDGMTATRQYRGATYNITVKNPDHVCKGVKSVTVDGKAVEGNVLPVAENGATVNVEVVMG